MQKTQNADIMPLLALCLLPSMFLLGGRADNYMLFTLGAVLSLLPEGAVLIILNAAFNKKGSPPRLLSLPLTAFIAAYFLAAGAFGVIHFVRISGFLSQHRTGAWLIAVPLLLSGAYIAFLSQGAQRRVCSAVLLVTLVMYGITVLLSLKNGSITYLHISSRNPLDDAVKGFAAGVMITQPDVYFLLCRITGRTGRLNIPRYLALKLSLFVIFTLPAVYVLGEHIRYSRMPAYDLAAFSKSVIIERFNGLYVLTLTLAAALLTALEMSAVRVCLSYIISGKEASNEKA